MGFLDRLLNKGAQALGDVVSDKLSEVVHGDNEVGDAVRSVTSAVSSMTNAGGNDTWGGRTREQAYRSFDEKLTKVVKEAGDYEIRRRVTLRELEQEFGEDIYVHDRSGCYCEPDDISYGIYQDGRRVLLIRLWDDYVQYNHAANREVWAYCKDHQVKILDFYDYLPNEEGYMADRIRKELVD